MYNDNMYIQIFTFMLYYYFYYRFIQIMHYHNISIYNYNDILYNILYNIYIMINNNDYNYSTY